MAFICSIPPIFGYGIVVLLSGFVFGFPLGFLPVFFGSLSGAFFVFTLGRAFEMRYIKNLVASQKHLLAFTKIIDKKGLKFLILFRLAPYPFNVTNLFLSTTNIPISNFLLATSVSLSRLFIHIYVGSQALSIAELIGYKDRDPQKNPDNEPVPKLTFSKVAPIIFTSSLAIIVFVYTYYLVRKELKLEVTLEESNQLDLDEL
ncbi:Golgi apparatus membrane protein tvp38 [Smittium mucronatum]|uniref:Golgi apparatus membrane protein TVP38 n=1 Tax=Smittium mucronatum TaxID=133383 RepID=A0A1R0H1N5_9FUNG|nr:Golgi apparatus membrane protein tvp38 [Smittium mucronatum]